ncbi:MAG: hypothetical protein L0K12_16035 [Brevibacterium aurantiacum]|nr:hypothetical protein [Brevibacterium aurantiacum]
MPLDPRNLETEQVGTRLRDGAVNPKAGDYLGPTNAGVAGELGNPHGLTVVSPELHAHQGVRPVRPGEVSDDAEVQSADETEHLQEWHPDTVAPEPDPEPDPDEGAE